MGSRGWGGEHIRRCWESVDDGSMYVKRTLRRFIRMSGRRLVISKGKEKEE